MSVLGGAFISQQLLSALIFRFEMRSYLLGDVTCAMLLLQCIFKNLQWR